MAAVSSPFSAGRGAVAALAPVLSRRFVCEGEAVRAGEELVLLAPGATVGEEREEEAETEDCEERGEEAETEAVPDGGAPSEGEAEGKTEEAEEEGSGGGGEEEGENPKSAQTVSEPAGRAEGV